MPCTLMTSHPTSNDSKQSGIGWSQHRLQAQRSRCPCNTRWCAVSWRTLASGTAHDSELQFERLHNVVLIPAVQTVHAFSKPTLLCAWFIHSSSHALRNCHKLSLNLKERGWLCHLDSFGFIWMLGFKKNGQNVICSSALCPPQDWNRKGVARSFQERLSAAVKMSGWKPGPNQPRTLHGAQAWILMRLQVGSKFLSYLIIMYHLSSLSHLFMGPGSDHLNLWGYTVFGGLYPCKFLWMDLKTRLENVPRQNPNLQTWHVDVPWPCEVQ